MVEQHRQSRGWHQHFIGSWARLNCENMPVIPAWLVRSNLDDPRRIPYLLVWKDERHDGRIKEAVRLARYVEPSNSRTADNFVELKRTDGSATVLRIAWRMLPRNGGRALFLLCPYCGRPRRHVYGWEWDSSSGWSNRVRSIGWRCRSCARLRYSCEGGYLRGRGRGALAAMFRAFGNLPRPESWLPHVFTSPGEAADAGFGQLSRVNW
jgi:hypothetical protein